MINKEFVVGLIFTHRYVMVTCRAKALWQPQMSCFHEGNYAKLFHGHSKVLAEKQVVFFVRAAQSQPQNRMESFPGSRPFPGIKCRHKSFKRVAKIFYANKRKRCSFGTCCKPSGRLLYLSFSRQTLPEVEQTTTNSTLWKVSFWQNSSLFFQSPAPKFQDLNFFLSRGKSILHHVFIVLVFCDTEHQWYWFWLS